MSTLTANAPEASLVAEVRAAYQAAGQGHVFTFYDKLSPGDQQALIKQLIDIDVHRVNSIFQRAVAPNDGGAAGEVLPLPESACATVIDNKENEARWKGIGLKAISENTVCVVLMAGGQGTRLGSKAPKGMYDINLPSGMTLFEYQALRIARLEQLAAEANGKKREDVRIRWYIMTSGPTKEDTVKYFESKAWFGLREDQVIFFEQGGLPAFANNGQLLLSSPSSLVISPEGNGGLYPALRRPVPSLDNRTVLSDLRSHGIKYVHVYGVDNCLVRVADPVFFGCCIEREAACGAKVVRKTLPAESVGVLAKRGDAFAVVEYSELSKEKAELRDANGQLSFKAANIVNHFYTTTFLESVEGMESKMSFHVARKKVPFVDLETGQVVNPTSPNGIKLELFVFDVFPFTNSMCVLEVDRAEEFSPLKNAPGSGSDCPETSRRDLLAQQRRWLVENGAIVRDDVEVELTPELTYAGEGLDWVEGKEFVRSGVVRSRAGAEALFA